MSTPETCRATYRNVINWIQSHLVWQLLNLIHDAWTHVYKKLLLHINVNTSGCQWCFLVYHNSAKCNMFLGSLVRTSNSSCMPGVSCFLCGRESRGTRWHTPGSSLSSTLCDWSKCFHWTVCMINLTWPLNGQARLILDAELLTPLLWVCFFFIYIYIYICVCVCVCACLTTETF